MHTTIQKGNNRFTPALLFFLAFISTVILGVLTGVFTSDSTLDIHLHNTYFVIAESYIAIAVACFFGLCAAIYNWFPRMFGRYMNNTMGHIHFWSTVSCAILMYWRMHFEGLAGMPRRYIDYESGSFINQFNDPNNFITMPGIVIFGAQMLFLFNFIYSVFRGRSLKSA
jgi:cytochrome c oxidase subunit I